MYWEECSPYHYLNQTQLRGVAAVGWLSAAREYRKGQVAPELFAKLLHLAVHQPITQTRGIHRCDFCGSRDVVVCTDTDERQLGSAELWIPGTDTLFAAPNLIVHYVSDHQYLPPEPFLTALATLDVSMWNPPHNYGHVLYLQQRPPA